MSPAHWAYSPLAHQFPAVDSLFSGACVYCQLAILGIAPGLFRVVMMLVNDSDGCDQRRLHHAMVAKLPRPWIQVDRESGFRTGIGSANVLCTFRPTAAYLHWHWQALA